MKVGAWEKEYELFAPLMYRARVHLIMLQHFNQILPFFIGWILEHFLQKFNQVLPPLLA